MDEPLVREYAASDFDAISKAHAGSGIDYMLPELSSPLFIVKTIVERAGKATSLLAGRVECETYLMTSGSPREKWEDIQALQPAYLSALWAQGIDSTYCVVPDEVNRYFGKRMRALGWEPARNWHPWTRSTVLSS